MSALGLDVFDRTFQVTNIWLDEIMEQLGPDRQIAWKVLSIVLHKLRDLLQPDLAAHLGAQLPLLVRGVYYDLYEPSKLPSGLRSREEFVSEVEKRLSDVRPVDPVLAVQAVLGVLSRHLSAGQIAKVREALPASTRSLWIAPQEALRVERS